MQARYQYGTLTLRKRKRGPDVWQWRYMVEGRRKSVLIGTVSKLPAQADAERALEARRLKLNSTSPQARFHSVTVGAFIARYVSDEMPKHCRLHTQRAYQSFINNYIKPQWGDYLLEDVRTIGVEDWLESLPRSRQLKSHVRNVMHVLFKYAMRLELLDRNPISLVRQSRKRLKTPRVLTPQELRGLLKELEEPYKTMVLIAVCLGLRVSELMGLQWGDFNWDNLTVTIRRSFVEGHIYETKTEASEKPLPLDADLAEVLLRHREQKARISDGDFVFAGDNGNPRWPDSMLTDHIKPAAVRAQIGKVGWHTFRHTYATLLHELGAKPAVQKELLRHADIQTTMNIYTQAVTPAKRKAAGKVARVLMRD